MKVPAAIWAALLCLAPLAPNWILAASSPTPLIHAHAHNDYEHARPLFDALEQGFCSVEADIYLVEGRLLVAHDRSKVTADRTLQRLYLDPLRERVRNNGGRVYPGGPPVTLLIDVKSEADPTYAALKDVLASYSDILTRFREGSTETNAITVVISGNRARQRLAEEPLRFAGLDGRPEDLDGTESSSLIPLVSEDWKRLFKWRGTGVFPPDEKTKLCRLVKKAHDQGRRIRFWGTTDSPSVWEELTSCGVDLLNADNLQGLREFLRARTKP